MAEDRVLCSICFKPLDRSRCKIDEDGHPVHDQCYIERLHFLSQVKKPPTNERTGSALQGWRELIQRGFWTIDNLTASFKALTRAGALQVRPDQPRNLTEHERRAIALQPGSGDVEGAISKYLLLRAPEDASEAFLNAPTISHALNEIADPALAKIVSKAVWYCWTHGDRTTGLRQNVDVSWLTTSLIGFRLHDCLMRRGLPARRRRRMSCGHRYWGRSTMKLNQAHRT